jgi:hypothetical protein
MDLLKKVAGIFCRGPDVCLRGSEVVVVICHSCEQAFRPKPMGYNARYCSDKCKRRSQRKRLRENNPEQLRSARARSYRQTKKHAERIAKHHESANRHRCRTRQWLSDYRLAQGCVDCGYQEHPAALQLDHEGHKSVEIADARSSIRRLQAEIESGNCKVRCANCHSIRTWKSKQKVTHVADLLGWGCE